MKLASLWVVLLVFTSLNGFTHEEDVGAVIGPGKAVEETRNERQEFKMSKASLELLGVKFVEVKAIARGIFLIPNSSVVSYQDNFGIYISEDGWFKLVTVEKKSTNESHTKIYSSLLKPTTKIVSKGLDFVRIAHVHLISTNHEEEEEGEED